MEQLQFWRTGQYTYERPYFCFTGRKDEVDALNIAKPDHILVAFNHLLSKKWLQLTSGLLENVTYEPKSIIMDSGAFEFYQSDTDSGFSDLMNERYRSDGESVEEAAHRMFVDMAHSNWQDVMDEPLFFQYAMTLYLSNADYAINMDVIGNDEASFESFLFLNAMFPGKIIPVFGAVDLQYRAPTQNTDYTYLHRYAEMSNYIAIGGFALKETRNMAKKEKIEWINAITRQYPDKKFHLLGCLDKYVLDRCENVYSSDGSAWIDKHGKWKRTGDATKAVSSAKNVQRLESTLPVKEVMPYS